MLARKVDHLMTLDVNKWRDVMQSVCHSSVLRTFLNVKHSEIEYVINRL